MIVSEHVIDVPILLVEIDRHVRRGHQLRGAEHRRAKAVAAGKHDNWTIKTSQVVRKRRLAC